MHNSGIRMLIQTCAANLLTRGSRKQDSFYSLFYFSIWKQGQARCADVQIYVYQYFDTFILSVQPDSLYAGNKGLEQLAKNYQGAHVSPSETPAAQSCVNIIQERQSTGSHHNLRIRVKPSYIKIMYLIITFLNNYTVFSCNI